MNKMIISLIIILTLFSYSLEGIFSCSRGYYICCSSRESESCQCVQNDTDKQCQTSIKCNSSAQSPLYIVLEKEIKARCID